MVMPVVVVVLVLAAIFLLGSYREEQTKKNKIENLIKSYGSAVKRKYTQDDMKNLGAYTGYTGKSRIDNITWNDLDMTMVYKKMNYCQTSAGDDYLYDALRNPKSSDYDWADYEKKVTAISESSDLRRELLQCLCTIGRSGKYSIYTYLDCLEGLKLESCMADILLDVLYIPAIALCFFYPMYGIAALFGLIVINIATYFKKKKKIEPYIVCFEYIYRVLKNSDLLCGIKDDILEAELTDLVNCTKKFSDFRRFSSFVIGDFGSGPIGIVLDYIRMLTHIDLIKFNSMAVCIKANKDNVIEIIRIIGRIDCYMSVGEYRTFLERYCIPSLDNDYKGISISAGYHPLLEKPVANSINTQKSVLLTGSNASGKSTFLKMTAINVLLAQTIHTCTAQSYTAPYYSIYTSLSLKDSILDGDSYYMAEIKALKRIIDASDEKGENVIGFVDEVLRGTNTVERISAGSAIMKNLIRKDVLLFAATHDIELTSIMNECDDYHFEEMITDDDISFSYELKEGKAVSRNAIMLLEKLGYDKDIILEANTRVKNYEQKGNWNQI